MASGRLILWPAAISLVDAYGTFVYGWTTPLLCVAGVLHSDTLEEADALLKSLRSPQEWDTVQTHCGSWPTVFGRCNSHTEEGGKLEALIETFGIAGGSAYTVVYYRRPNLRSMEIYSLDFRIYATNATLPFPIPYDMHDFTIPSKTSSSLDPIVLRQINHGTFLDQEVQHCGRRAAKSRTTIPMLASALHFIRQWSPARCGAVNPTRRAPSVSGEPAHSSTVLNILSGFWGLCNEVSACCHQVDVRLEQGIILPTQVPRLYRSTTPATSHYISFYVNFWNNVWLILNDITIGIAIGSFLCENSLPLAQLFSGPLKASLIDFPQDALLWLNNWPAGLKLNTELSRFYCHSLLGVVMVWNRVLETLLLPSLPTLLYVAGAMGTCGMTMTISILSDLLGCFTMHLFICYRASALIFSQQLTVAGSLWNLFRGKRYNILRKRTDAWDYDVDQLFLGTMLFTLVAFLSPTVLTYYAFFATTRLFVVISARSLDTMLVLMNHFPLFALLLRVKNPLRMPGGVIYKLPKGDLSPLIEIQPIAFTRIFDHYVSLGSRLWSHYHPLRLFRMIFRGDPLTTIPRQFIRLPSVHKAMEPMRQTD